MGGTSNDFSSGAPADLNGNALSIRCFLCEGDASYSQRAEDGQVQKALESYQKVLSLDPSHLEALWKSAQCYYWLADQLPRDRREARKALYTKGITAAQQALRIDPRSLEAHFWYGVLVGEFGFTCGLVEGLFAIRPVIESMEKVLEIDPGNAFACHILGVVYRLAPGWPFSCGDLNRSLAYARQALERRPDSILVRLGLAETLQALGKKEEAREELNTALGLSGPADLQPETAKEKKAVQALLAQCPY